MNDTTNMPQKPKSILLARGLYTTLFLFIGGFLNALIAAISTFQFLSLLLSGTSNTRLHSLSQGISQYCQQIADFLLFNTEEKPYPFKEWPLSAESTPITDAVSPEATP